MKYIIGIDLGTTNSSLAFIALDGKKANIIQQLQIPQLGALGTTIHSSLFPSCCYIPSKSDTFIQPLPTRGNLLMGQRALLEGSRIPNRMVASAKSWLCQPATLRKDKILPLDACEETLKLSPSEATTSILAYIREAWINFDKHEDFKVVLTLPASFDEVARELTLEAANAAGFGKITLLEEPQAAFYSWIATHEKSWETHFQPKDTILVIDVGGGTTDFTLIEVEEGKENKKLFQRKAVGDHLLLGGDNMDEMLLYYAVNAMEATGPQLTSEQKARLRSEVRRIKEAAFSSEGPLTIILEGSGSSVVGGARKTALDSAEVRKLLLNGFFGQYDWEEAVKIQKKQGIRTLGLPYEEESSITRHLANFLMQHKANSPDFIYFNGGAMKPEPFRQAIKDSLNHWFPNKKIKELPTSSLDLAVSKGAAYFGLVQEGLGVRIGGGAPRAYYIELEGAENKALTLIPRGAEEGDSFELKTTFLAKANTPTIFRLYSSHIRLGDQLEELVPLNEIEMSLLPPIQTLLRFGKEKTFKEEESIPVHIQAELTPIGTVEIYLKSLKTANLWKLEFYSKSGQKIESTKHDELHDINFLKPAQNLIEDVYSKRILKPNELIQRLEELIDKPKEEWPLNMLRALFPTLIKEANYRDLSQEHNERWWNLIGYFLRPGFGHPLDEHFIKELWKIILSDKDKKQVQHWISYRRIAGGLTKGQQTRLAHEIMAIEIAKRDKYLYSEKVRTLASFELMDTPWKIKFGKELLAKIESGNYLPCDLWALGKLASRHLSYGALPHVLPKEIAEEWARKLSKSQNIHEKELSFALRQIAKSTKYQEINISEEIRQDILKRFPEINMEDTINEEESAVIFGDRLPVGLKIL